MNANVNTNEAAATATASTAAPRTSNYNGSEAKILDQLVIAAADNANAIRDAMLHFANAKDGGLVHRWTLANLAPFFRKRAEGEKDHLGDLLKESAKMRDMIKARVDADADKTEQGKELKRDIDRRIQAARTNVTRALSGVYKMRVDGCKTDAKLTKKGLVQYTDKDGEAITASASILAAEGSKAVAAKIGKQVTRAKQDDKVTNNGIVALQAALGRVLTCNRNNVPLANVPVEGTYWAALYLALADNMRLEKSDGGKVERRAASTLIEGSTIKTLEAFAKEAMAKVVVNPASPNANKTTAKPRTTAKVGR